MKHTFLHIFLVCWAAGFLFSCQQKNNNSWADEQAETLETEVFEEDDEIFFPEEAPADYEMEKFQTENSQRIKAYKTEPVEGILIPEQTWREKTKGTEYNEKEKEKKPEKNSDLKFRKPFNPDSVFFKAFVYLLVISAIGALLFILIRNYMKGKKGAAGETALRNYNFSEISEEELKLLNTEDFITKAETARDFKTAFRLRYLQLLKKLAELKWIRFKKDFTNRDYLRQLSDKDIAKEFALLTLHFDSYWYGDVDIDEEKYKKVLPVFRQIEAGLKKKEA